MKFSWISAFYADLFEFLQDHFNFKWKRNGFKLDFLSENSVISYRHIFELNIVKHRFCYSEHLFISQKIHNTQAAHAEADINLVQFTEYLRINDAKFV